MSNNSNTNGITDNDEIMKLKRIITILLSVSAILAVVMITLDVIFAGLMILLMCIFIKNYKKNKSAAAAGQSAQA